MMQRIVIAQSIGSDSTGGIVRLQRLILRGSLTIEGIGAVLLTLRFWQDYDFTRALKMGIFHSVSAFCNAGFDTMGFISPGASVSAYAADPAVMITLMGLIVTGGLGFIVWQEMLTEHSFKKLSVYAKLVIITTSGLILGGAAAYLLLEWNNPGTLGSLSAGEKILAGFFQSVTTRTAGFAGFDQGSLTDAGKAVTMILMLVGGSSGSTAGGLKTVTLVVIVMFIVSHARGRDRVNIFGREIPGEQAMNALTIFGIMVSLAVFGAVLICATSPVKLTDGMYEAVSALATVGLSTGATARLSFAARIVIILYMYFGRVGVLTISLGFLMGKKTESSFRYAKTNLLIG